MSTRPNTDQPGRCAFCTRVRLANGEFGSNCVCELKVRTLFGSLAMGSFGFGFGC